MKLNNQESIVSFVICSRQKLKLKHLAPLLSLANMELWLTPPVLYFGPEKCWVALSLFLVLVASLLSMCRLYLFLERVSRSRTFGQGTDPVVDSPLVPTDRPSLCLSLSLCHSFFLSVCVCVSVCLPVCLSVCPSVTLSFFFLFLSPSLSLFFFFFFFFAESLARYTKIIQQIKKIKSRREKADTARCHLTFSLFILGANIFHSLHLSRSCLERGKKSKFFG